MSLSRRRRTTCPISPPIHPAAWLRCSSVVGRRRVTVLAVLACSIGLAAVTGGRAKADPILEIPQTETLRWGKGRDAPVSIGLALELRAQTRRELSVEQGASSLEAARIATVTNWRGRLPLTLVLRADLSEVLWRPRHARPLLDNTTGGLVSAIVDDAYLVWRGSPIANLSIGRMPVFFAKLRHFDDANQPLGVLPPVVERIAPDRRWGTAVIGDLGAIAYGLGLYEDLDAMRPLARSEPHSTLDDPSAGGRTIVVGRLEWTPLAPMMGSNPPGAVVGAAGALPTPRADPWFETLRLSFGVGGCWRERDSARGRRWDFSLSGQAKWRWWAALAEVFASDDPALGASPSAWRRMGGYAELLATPRDSVALMVGGEWDGGVGTDGEWTVSGGIGYHLTRNRRNKIVVSGWHGAGAATTTTTTTTAVSGTAAGATSSAITTRPHAHTALLVVLQAAI
ncbi:MAG: hypothetical protein V2A73_22905 [Pseudomonadota bacterium]